jgi:RHS repeat-associated protein
MRLSEFFASPARIPRAAWRTRHPLWRRCIALGATIVFAWYAVAATPLQAFAPSLPVSTHVGMRKLHPEEMRKIMGSLSTTPVSAAAGGAYSWEGSSGGTNTGNGNKQTLIPIVSWTARGGLPMTMALAHNSESTRNADVGQKWTYSFSLYGGTDGFGNFTAHWGDDLAYTFSKNVDGSFTAPTGIHDTLVKNADNTYTLTKPSQIKYHYNTSFYCDTISDENGNAITLAYNAGNHVTSITDPTGRALTLSYDANNHLTTITDPLSRQWTLSYDSSSNLQSVSLPALSGTTYTYTFSYDTSHDITDLKTPRGYHYTFSYNSGGGLVWEKDPAGNQTSFSYTSSTGTVTDPNGNATIYTYASGKLTQVKDPLGYHEDYQYDASNNRTQLSDKRGYVWQSSYDSNGNTLTKTDPYLSVTTYTYNGHNKVLTVTDALNHTTTSTYNANDNLLSTTDALGHTTTYVVNAYGLCTSATDALTHQTTFGYDANGDLTSMVDPLSNTTTAAYDTLGRKTSTTDALNNTTTFTYDAWGRTTVVTTPAGSTTTTFDADGNVTGVTDANSHTVTNVYDSCGRMISTTKANGDSVVYTFDGIGQKGLLSSITDGNNHTSSFTYTVRNEKASASYPDSTGESWTYDACSNLATHTDGNGNTIQYAYDHAGKQIGITYPTGTNPSFTYDVANHLTGITDTTGTTGYTFDNASRLTQIAEPNGTVGYGYDNAGRRTSVTVTGTGTWTYTFDNANRLTGLINPFSETTSFTYDADNHLTQKTNGNGAITSLIYDTDSRVTDVWHKKSDNITVLGHYEYSYDGVGNVTSRADNDGSTTSFGYDSANQVTSEVRTGPGAYSVSYTYDHNGNRTTKVLNGATDTYTYDAHNKLLSTSSKTYTYDHDGNCKTVTTGGQTTTLTYDYEDRITGITYQSGATNSFTYNALDLRERKVDSAGTFNYVTDGTAAGSAVLNDSAATYTPGLSERRGTTSKFYHSDALGSTRGITDGGQNATDSLLYDAFGMVVSRTGTTPTPFGFVGASQYQSDNDSGLMLLGHRYYDSSTGRFISSDPAHAGINWYAYCYNNPLRGIDPLGLDWLDDAANFFAGWGDTLTGGGTQVIRKWIGVDDPVNPNSGWYQGGQVVGTIHLIAIEIADGGEGPAPGGGGVEPPIEPPAGGGNCFVAGTLITMADGSQKPVEQIKAGDQVLTRHIESANRRGTELAHRSTPDQEIVAKQVVRTFAHDHAATLTLHLAGGESITTTPGHPFYVADKGFVLAGHLAVGNAIVTRAGPAVKIENIEQSGVATVYTFEVADTHTYFVGKTNGGLWVHNISVPGEGTLTEGELNDLQGVADQYNTPIDVVGSRGGGGGRNIGTDLPVGKGEGTRSDIDVKVDGQVDIDTSGRMTDDLKNIGGGDLVNVGARNYGGSYPPYIQIRPGLPPVIVPK